MEREISNELAMQYLPNVDNILKKDRKLKNYVSFLKAYFFYDDNWSIIGL